MTNKYVTYCRVSTKKQEVSGLGLEAQRSIISAYLPKDAEVVGEFWEAHSGTDLKSCKELQRAISLTKSTGAILIVAKYDRFRDLRGALDILEELGEDKLFCCDMPSMSNPVVRTVMFTLAAEEARWISERTKAALAVRKRQIAEEGGFISTRGGNYVTSLGNPRWMDYIDSARESSLAAFTERYASDPKRKAAYTLAVDLMKRGDSRGKIISTLNALGDTMLPEGITRWTYKNFSTMIKRMG